MAKEIVDRFDRGFDEGGEFVDLGGGGGVGLEGAVAQDGGGSAEESHSGSAEVCWVLHVAMWKGWRKRIQRIMERR